MCIRGDCEKEAPSTVCKYICIHIHINICRYIYTYTYTYT